MTDHPGQEIRACGAVLWRPGSRGPEVALIHRPRYGDWSFPKGKQDRGEHPLLTARREVLEETGIPVVLGRRLESTSYLSDGRPKRVSYWAATPAAPGCQEFVPNAEVDRLDWLGLDGARERLSYAHDVKVLEGFAAGPAATTAVMVLRHATAVGKQGWRRDGHPDDLARPLSARGVAQAAALGQLLCCFAPARVIASGAERCVATVRPYATLTGTVIEAEPSFTLNGGGAARPSAQWEPTGAARRVVAGALAAPAPVLFCGHRQNLPLLMAWACEELGVPVPEGPPLAKGSFWVLQAGAGMLASAERHAPGS